MDFEVSPITLSPDYLTRREYYTGPATAIREFLHNSKHKGSALNAANQWTNLTTHKVGEEDWTCLSFLDDGCSMDRAELRQAVKFDPPKDKAACTTSRFGEGMKAAAFWLSSERSAIFLFALKGTERTVVMLGGNDERDLDRCSLIIAPEIKEGDGADEMLACARKERKAGLRETIDRLCRLPSSKGCAGNEQSPFDGVQDLLRVFAGMQTRTQTDHAFMVQIWNPRGKDPSHSQEGLSAVFLGSPAGVPGMPSHQPQGDSKAALELLLAPDQSRPETDPHMTIMLRDKDGKETTLSSVCQRLFLPQDQQEICNGAFYSTRSRMVPSPKHEQAMRMHVCGQLVRPAGHPWSQVLQAGGQPSALLSIGDGLGCMQLVSLPEPVYGKPGQVRLPGSGIIFVGAGSDHTLNLDPIIPDLHARYTNLLPSIVMASRSDTHYNNLWTCISELCGGSEELSGIISRATFMRACRPCKGGQNMRFLRAICLQPYLALVQAASHASLQYDPSKTDIRISPAFAQGLMRVITSFAVEHHLPQEARAPAPKNPPSPATPHPAAPRPVSRKHGSPQTAAAAAGDAAGGSEDRAGVERRKSKRSVAPPQLYVPDSGTPNKRPRRAMHKNEPQLVQAAVADFCPRAEKILAEMKSAKRSDVVAQLSANFRHNLTVLNKAAAANGAA
ncbi:hypothetical protein WJX74_004271 [Apatococcus lobatus]|uniref:Uncharacterized protein n=1 Tax=Apatococcus lobatus TaxID=904363 RepID=A0AAW1QX21_9CHLO